MKYDFDRIISRKGSNSLKWDFSRQRVGVDDVLPMWVADMDFEAPAPVVEAIQQRAKHGIFGYTGIPNSYYQAVIGWMKKRFNWEIKKEWIVLTPGVISALHLAVQAFTHPGDKVIIQPPVYYPFFWAVENNGRLLVNNTLINDNGRYLMDFESLEKSIDDRTRLLILCSPHNPVGRVWKEEELEKLVQICLEHKIIIISDEIHADLIMKGYKHIPTVTISEEAAQIVVTCTAPSKTFNIAGLEMANIIISNKFLYNQFKTAVRKAGLMHASLFGLAATEAAYNQREEWLQQLLDYLEGNYEFLCSFVVENMPGIKVTPLEGTYLVWLDFRSLALPDEELKNLLLKKARVWLDDGPMFGPGGDGFQRINIACPRKILKEGLIRIARAVQRVSS